MLSPFRARLWNQPIYAALLQEVNPANDSHLFRPRDIAYGGDQKFWATPSPEPELPANLTKKLSEPLASSHPICLAASTLASRIAECLQPEEIIFVAILRAGVPVADWLTRLLPGSVAVATSLFVGWGIDQVALNQIRDDHPERQCVFVDGWTGKGAVAGELRKLGAGPLAVLCDPWQCAEYCGTRDDLLSPSAFFTGPTTLGFSRTFVRSAEQPFAAYQFPVPMLVPSLVEAWQHSCPRGPFSSAAILPSSPIHHVTPLRVHSNEVGRALINSNPSELLFADSPSTAREQFSLLVELAEHQRVPIRFNVADMQQINARVACSLKVRT